MRARSVLPSMPLENGLETETMAGNVCWTLEVHLASTNSLI